MKVLVLGNDGRAHALVWKLFNSSQTSEVLCAPGNGGTQQLAPQLDLDLENAAEIARWSFEEGVGFVVPTSDVPLRAGLVDEAIAFHTDVCGPPQQTLRLGESRCYAKEFLLRYKLPTAQGRVFADRATAERYLVAQPLPIVVKADNRTIASDVYHDRYAALQAMNELFATHPLEGSNDGVVIEPFLPGFRISISAITDGKTTLPLLPTRVYDRLQEGDRGTLAAGMGAHTSTSTYANKLTIYLKQHVLEPLVAALEREGLPYRGILGVDCIITEKGPRINALRCEMRDQEAQVVLPRLEEDLMPLFRASLTGQLDQLPPPVWKDEVSVGIALVTEGYPHNFPTDRPIDGLTGLDPGVLVFHDQTYSPYGMRYQPSASPQAASALAMGAGAGNQPATFTTTGGHILTVVATAATLNGARGKAILNAERITFAGRYFRSDIGQKEFV